MLNVQRPDSSCEHQSHLELSRLSRRMFQRLQHTTTKQHDVAICMIYLIVLTVPHCEHATAASDDAYCIHLSALHERTTCARRVSCFTTISAGRRFGVSESIVPLYLSGLRSLVIFMFGFASPSGGSPVNLHHLSHICQSLYRQTTPKAQPCHMNLQQILELPPGQLRAAASASDKETHTVCVFVSANMLPLTACRCVGAYK